MKLPKIGVRFPLDEGYCRNCQERHGEPYRSWLAHHFSTEVEVQAPRNTKPAIGL